jgi:hypothetical protein
MKLKFRYILIFLFLTNIYSYRDPFSFPNATNQIKEEVFNIKQTINILAILQGKNKRGAILKKDDHVEVAFVGDIVWEYEIENIDKDIITLVDSNQKKIKLFYEDKD